MNNTERPVPLSCDPSLPFSWYRFQGAAGSRLPTACPPSKRCQTESPGWLNVKDKPLPPEGVTEKSKVYFKGNDETNCCEQSKSFEIKIKNCSSYFVYELFRTPGCDLRYCGID